MIIATDWLFNNQLQWSLLAVNCSTCTYTTECAEILKLLCVALLDDHLALEYDTHPFAGVRAHALQFADMRTIAVMLSGGAAVQSVRF